MMDPKPGLPLLWKFIKSSENDIEGLRNLGFICIGLKKKKKQTKPKAFRRKEITKTRANTNETEAEKQCKSEMGYN